MKYLLGSKKHRRIDSPLEYSVANTSSGIYPYLALAEFLNIPLILENRKFVQVDLQTKRYSKYLRLRLIPHTPSFWKRLAIGLNSSDVSATLIDGIRTSLKDNPQKFMYMVNDVQATMECCGFIGNHKEWMQNKTIYYYDPIEDKSKVMPRDQAQNIWKLQHDEEKMNSSTLSCCSNIKKHCPEKKMRQQNCFNKLSITIDWLVELIGIALPMKFMLSVLQEAIFTYIAVDITAINTAVITVLIVQ